MLPVDTRDLGFSSYTKGLHPVDSISIQAQYTQIALHCPVDFHQKLKKRVEKHQKGLISIDGACAQVDFNQSYRSAEAFVLVAKVAQDAFLNSALINLKMDHQVCIGMTSTSPDKYLLQSIPIGKIFLEKIGIAQGHRYLKELTFECSDHIYERIQRLSYIGLNASGLLLHKPCSLEGRNFFSIVAGKATRERTIFGSADLYKEAEFNLSLPFIPK